MASKGNPADYPLSEDDDSEEKMTKIALEFLIELLNILEDEDISSMELKAHVPELCVVDFKVKSEGLGVAMATAMLSSVYKMLLQEL